jgi:hypothetical protein
MVDVKGQVAAAIVKARDHLEQALSELGRLSALDPSAVAFSAHALNNYLAVTGHRRGALNGLWLGRGQGTDRSVGRDHMV